MPLPFGRTMTASSAITFALFTGCAATPEGPSVAQIAPLTYANAFDAACVAAKDAGFRVVTADRQTGVIETAPAFMGSLVEPWEWEDMTLSQVGEASLNFERRRLRFEFVPANFQEGAAHPDAPIAGPSIAGSARLQSTDLARTQEALELRVVVSVERRFQPGTQRNAWTRSITSTMTDVTQKDDGMAARDASRWTAFERDERLELQLLRAIEAQLSVPTAS